jgi:2'-hydroxyisoflavone reductase
MGKKFENFGGLKRLCEEAAEAAFPDRAALIRPGYIVGPDDPTDRFTYWPVRYARGGEMLAPGSPEDPIQIIDVRDLAEWLVKVFENNLTGVYNAVGPEKPWTMGGLLAACKEAAGKTDTKPVWVPSEFLLKNGHREGHAGVLQQPARGAPRQAARRAHPGAGEDAHLPVDPGAAGRRWEAPGD